MNLILALKHSLGIEDGDSSHNPVVSNKEKLIEMHEKEKEYYLVMKPKENDSGSTTQIVALIMPASR